MSGRERPIDERALDALLGAWLSEGADAAPDRLAERALLEVATTPQEGTQLQVIWGSMTAAPMAWTSVVLVLAISLGLLIGPRLVGDGPTPSPVPSGSPSPSPAPSAQPDASPQAVVVLSLPEDGYELSVPVFWREVKSPYPNARRFEAGSPNPQTSLTIAIPGTSGFIQTCGAAAGPWETCQEVIATTLDELTDAVSPHAADDHGVPVPGPVTRGTLLLDGEVANRISVESYEFPARGAEHVTYVVAFHEGRPIILRFHTMVDRPPLRWVSNIVEGFRFLDDAAPAWPLITDTGRGIEFEIPSGWRQDRTSEFMLSYESGAAAIFVGETDGSIRLCQTGGCDEFVITSLEDFRAAVRVDGWGGEAYPPPSSGQVLGTWALELGGEPAEHAWPRYYPGPVTYEWVYAIHDGRPVALRFRNHSPARPPYLSEIVESFRFLD